MSSRTHRTAQLAGHVGESADLHKLPGVEAGAPDKGPVDIRLSHDPRDVRRLDRATVKDTYRGRHFGVVQLRESLPQRAADLLGVVRRGHLAGADRPARLV